MTELQFWQGLAIVNTITNGAILIAIICLAERVRKGVLRAPPPRIDFKTWE